jgi:ATP-binding cassette, subfamily B, bacterial
MTSSLKQYWDLLARYIQPQMGRFTLLALLLLGSIALQLINPQIIRSFIDLALAGEALERLSMAAAAFIGITLLQQGVSVGVRYLGENVAWTATNALRSEMAWHCLNLDMGFHNEHTPGELIERIDGDITELATFFSQFVITLLGNGLLLLGILGVLLLEDWRVGLAFTVFAVVAMLALNAVRNIAVEDQKAFKQANADMFGFLEEQMAGTEDIRSNGAVGYALQQMHRLQSNILRHDRRTNFKTWIIGNITGVVLLIGNILAIGSGYTLYMAGAITVGTVYLLIHYINMLEQPIWALTREVESFQTIGACVERLSELRKIQPRVQDGSREMEKLTGSTTPLSVTFDQVSFGYEQDEPILKKLTFTLQPGTVLGLLGRTGSGKTTLTRLVFRLYDPSAGRILLDGVDVRELRLQSLRNDIAIVTQDVQLFRASVRENLTFFDRSITDRQIEAAIEELGLMDWFRSLPDGLETRLDSGGHSLSAGEAQLLAFTRVFLRDPRLVILDEASSRLDPLTEERIERAIDKLLVNRTAIIIAHRLHTVQRADEVLIIEDGAVSEHGQREALSRDSGSRFYNLLRTGLEEVLA